MSPDTLIWILVAESVLVIVVFGGIVAYLMHGSRDMQERLTTNSRALKRYIRHLLSPEFQDAVSAQLRSRIEEETTLVWRERERLLAVEQEALAVQAKELETLRQELSNALSASEAASGQSDDPDELERRRAFREELEKVKQHIAVREIEIENLRERINPDHLDTVTNELLIAEQTQRTHHKHALREMEICVQMMEEELAHTKQALALTQRRLEATKILPE